ncbi:MAG TPA: glycosyltransferase family 2 protein [Gammaproteobacteria bacterium]|nr:glycosyltransferase family 2 protein [Xanthomonadales bacterium]MCB1595061.1 glycosyltransferase family 2 protein [Xanthomonadales bacterium]HPI95662.1 glycosyltransferase family 2 protein [Gammaproteobacteria bacterium]HPQ87028.1 glycosyltransferase family 2 protein [Gammaproteobacteria bacterium]
MKLIIQIPCYNEAETLALALKSLPREIDGLDEIKWLIINDGSNDNTVDVAKECGVDYIVNFIQNRGLAEGFMAGIKECIKQGADIIVNTDADNQYEAKDIPKLIKPILDNKAEYVIGERPINQTKHFSFMKKMLQKIGSWVVRKASNTLIPDAPSGFRAMSRECAKRLNVYNEYTYTLETIIQAGQKNFAVTSVPIRTNEDLRPSKLVSSIPSYIKKSVITIVRIFVVYQPFKFFMSIAIVLFSIGFILGLRFLYYWMAGNGEGHIQSVILSGVLMGVGFQTSLIAFIADLLSVNRKLLEEIKVASDTRQ